MLSLQKALDSLACLFGLEEPKLVPTRAVLTHKTVSTESLRYSLGYQGHVFAPTIRAKELAIHLRNKHGKEWREYIDEVYPETPEVLRELKRIDLEKPVVSMTRDGVLVVLNGFHTVCAYRSQGYSQIDVAVSTPYIKTSEELSLKTFDQLTIYSHLR